jgi:Protein of unknown function (DUF1553)/Protein of unknown function (DUF1549)/Planctomycete cytochrome C
MRELRLVMFGLLLFAIPLTGRLHAEERVDYVRSIKPILSHRCYSCHGGLQQMSKLRVDTVDLIKKGGNSGLVIVAGSSAKSLLVEHITASNGASRMPPPSEGDGLKPNEIALIRTWIDQGAVGPTDEKPETDPKEHWAFKKPAKAALPDSSYTNVVDKFLDVQRRARNLKAQPAADPRLLLRRVYLDLIGLPPTLDEQEKFVHEYSAKSQAAYEAVVDRLLNSKQYGERWGRHWMDIWRYSDWWGLGAEVRNSQKHIWHWRDWVIESINADKGYDQMIREMLAADELYPTDADKLRGTGFLARQYFIFNRNTWLEETVEHTSKAFLGLTFNCSKCHDHKYDPISQQDFYRFRAFFEPYQVRTDMTAGEPDFIKNGIPRAFDCNLEAPTHLFVRGDEKNPKKDTPIAPGLPDILTIGKLQIVSIALPFEAHSPGLRKDIIEAYVKAAEQRIATCRQALVNAEKAVSEENANKSARQIRIEKATLNLAQKSLALAAKQLDGIKARAAADAARFGKPPAPNPKDLAKAAALAEKQIAVVAAEEALAKIELENASAEDAKKKPDEKKLAAAKEAVAKAKKELEAPGETYASLRGSLKTLENNLESEASRGKPFPTTSTGRRTALAKWITDVNNPLTARVAVNHIWARHFGKPLVASVFDFGRKGAAPTHPELLDHLAVELMEKNWSMKHLHRLIVTSAAYQMSSSSAIAAPTNLTVDVENKYLWRMNPLRMEAQVIRDSLLHLSGELDLTIGGPTIAANAETNRRSLYFFHSHNEYNRFLANFDDANVLECYRRAESIVPQQALTLENSKLALTAAAKIAKRITAKDDAEFVKKAFATVLSSSPTSEEQRECELALMELQEIAAREKKADGVLRSRINLINAMLNHNDFVTVR